MQIVLNVEDYRNSYNNGPVKERNLVKIVVDKMDITLNQQYINLLIS